jgi:hypothetical protein
MSCNASFFKWIETVRFVILFACWACLVVLCVAGARGEDAAVSLDAWFGRTVPATYVDSSTGGIAIPSSASPGRTAQRNAVAAVGNQRSLIEAWKQ